MMQKNGKVDYKHKYQLQKASGETQDQLDRQEARRMYDKASTGTVTKKAPERIGNHIDHKVRISDGGTNAKGNLRLRSPKANMSDNGKRKKA
jgi:DUF4097 and DUF4098 domain-containing protein YvlB